MSRTTESTRYRWYICAASFVGLLVCQSPAVFLSFGVFMKPLAAAFGWERGPMSLALSFCAISLALVSPLAGSLIDRFGARRVLLPSMISFGLVLASLYFLSGSLLQFYALYILLGIVGAGANNVAFMRVITAWFGRLRGRALGIASSGVTMGAAVLSFIAQLCISQFGWRAGYLGIAAVILLVAVPIVALVIRDRPADLGLESEASAGEMDKHVQVPLTELLRRPIAWVLVLIGFLVAVSMHGSQVHMVPIMTDRGMSPLFAAGGMAFLMAVSSVIGRISVGALFDYFFAPRVAILAFLVAAGGVLLMMLSKAIWPCYVFVITMGFGSGAESDVLGYLTSRYFGLRAFGRVYGMVFAGFMFGTALAPYFFGAIFDRTGNYRAAFAVSAVLILMLCLVLALLPRFPALTSSVLEAPEAAAPAGAVGATAPPA
jgi:MFS family permease